jgi:hypothetical protein
MNLLLPCPYLKARVELSDERALHIAERHPDLFPEHSQRIGETLADPDEVRRSSRLGSARLFSRWFGSVRGGKYVVVVVVSDVGPQRRHWVITAYLARRLTEGEREWTKS